MNRDMPSISASTYSSQAVNLAAMGNGLNQMQAQPLGGVWVGNGNALEDQIRRAVQNKPASQPIMEIKQMANRRLVQVFIADPNDNVPLDQSLLYSGEQKFTDATDQELFFEIDINTILKAYNEKRVRIVDKKVKERTEYLEAAKIRDLKMVVVTVAAF